MLSTRGLERRRGRSRRSAKEARSFDSANDSRRPHERSAAPDHAAAADPRSVITLALPLCPRRGRCGPPGVLARDIGDASALAEHFEQHVPAFSMQ